MGTVSSAKVVAIPIMDKAPGADDGSRDGNSSRPKGFAGHRGFAGAGS